MPAARAPAAQAMQSHSKAYKAIAWPKPWPAPARGWGPAHTQGQDLGALQRERLKPAASGTTSSGTMALTGEMGEFYGGSHIPVQAAAQLPPLHAHFRSDLRHGVGSCTVERRAEGHWLGPGMPSPVLGCRPGSQSHISDSRSPSHCGGHTPEGASPAPSAEAVQNFTFLLQLSARNTPVLGCS